MPNGDDLEWRRKMRAELEQLREAMPHGHHPREVGGILMRVAPGEAGYLAACEMADIADRLRTLEGYCSALKEANDLLTARVAQLEGKQP